MGEERRSRPGFWLLVFAFLLCVWLFLGREVDQGSLREAQDTRAPAPVAALEPARPVAGRETLSRTRVEPMAAAPSGDPDPTESLLIVQVVTLESGEPLGGLPVVLHTPKGSWSDEPAAPPRGKPGESILTDAHGRAEFAVTPGEAYFLRVSDRDHPEAKPEREEIAPLASGERRELRIALATALDRVWYARIVDGEDGVPLANARVERVLGNPFRDQRGEVHARSAADGSIALPHASWAVGFARVEREGWAPAFTSLAEGHADPARPATVRLLRNAVLEARVSDQTGVPQPDVRVELSCSSYEQLQESPWLGMRHEVPPFEARTDAQGSCVLEGLPPGIALTLELFAGQRSLRREERALRLEPGERRASTWSVGAGCSLSGITLDGEGRPVAGVTVCVLPQDGREGGWLLQRHRSEAVVARTKSDTGGRFEFSDLAAGQWRVGPAPEQDMAALAVSVELTPDQPHSRVTLTCWRGLYLRGEVLDPEGERVLQGYVSARGEQANESVSVRDGSFRIGPLPPGDYSLVAGGHASQSSDSEPLVAEAGSDGLVLRLRRGGQLKVRVLDQRGEPVAQTMVWLVREGGEGTLGTFTSTAGEIERKGMLPGTYSISATSPLGEFGLREGIQVAADGPPSQVELRLEPACRLRIEVDGTSELRWGIQLARAGRVFAFAFVQEDPVVVVPAGELEVLLVRHGLAGVEVLERQSVRTELGREASVAIDLSALGH